MPIAHKATATPYAAVAEGATHNFAYPASVEAGDFLVLAVSNNVTDMPAPTPSGWTLAITTNPAGTGRNSAIFYKVASGSESGSVSLTWPASVWAQGGIVSYTGVDPTTPLDVAPVGVDSASSTSHNAPALTPASDGTLIIHTWMRASAGVWTTDPTGVTIRFEQEATSQGRCLLYADKAGPASGVSSGTVGASLGTTSSAVMQSVALRSAPFETMRPTGVSGLSNLTGLVTDIDSDPDLTITDPGLVGDDGLASGYTPAFYADAQQGATGIANQLTNPANALGSSEASQSATTGATQNADYANFFTFDESAIASAIPAGATLTNVACTLRDALSNLARGDVGVRFDTTNGTLLAAEDISEGGLTTTLPAAGNGVHESAPASVPSRTQAVASSFGVRVRYRRTVSQAATFTLDWLRILFFFNPVAINTQADVALDNPTQPLMSGQATGEIRARFRKHGSGTSPQGRIELRNAAGTLLLTPIPDTTITATGASGQLVSGTFDQSIITDKNDVVARFVGTGAAGGLAELVAIEWNAQIEEEVTLLAGTSRAVSYSVSSRARSDTNQILYNTSSVATPQSRALSYDVAEAAPMVCPPNLSFDQAIDITFDQLGYCTFDEVGEPPPAFVAATSRDLSYQALSLTPALSRSVLYSVFDRATADARAVSYSVSARAQAAARVTLYSISSRAQAARVALYWTYSLAPASRIALYSVSSRANQARLGLFNVLGNATQSRVIGYHISAKASPAWKAVLFDIFGRAGSLRTLSFDGYALTGESLRSVRYEVFVLAGSTNRTLVYDLLGKATSSRIALYNVVSLIPVASSQSTISFEVRALALGPAHALRFSTLALVPPLSRSMLFHIAALGAPQARPLSFDVFSLSRADPRVLRFNVEAEILLAQALRDLSYHLRGKAEANRASLYSVYSRVGTSGISLYHVRGLTGSEAILVHAVSTPSGTARTIYYDLGGYVLTSRLVLYRVERLGAEFITLLEGEIEPNTILYDDIELATLIEEKIIPASASHILSVDSTSELAKRLLIPTNIREIVYPA